MQNDYLSKKLADANASLDNQKEHFRDAIEELQKKLQETAAGRQQLLALKERDLHEQEEIISRLQVRFICVISCFMR